MGLVCEPCRDSEAAAQQVERTVLIDRGHAATLGTAAVKAINKGHYRGPGGQRVDWSGLVDAATTAKISIPPDVLLPEATTVREGNGCRVTVSNETSLSAARRFGTARSDVLVLNMANGVVPGGGFRRGARAQEEYLCRSSALYGTLDGDPMYAAHRDRDDFESSDHAILSPQVPVFCDDAGETLDSPWTTAFITCAAPVATRVGVAESGELMAGRIERLLKIAAAHGFRSLVLGAWGCGAFGNDAEIVARHFHTALEARASMFDEVVFAVVDWSPERRFLGPFCKEFTFDDAAR